MLQCVCVSGRFAYVEFADKDSAQTALALNESLFKGRQLKVCILLFLRSLHALNNKRNLSQFEAVLAMLTDYVQDATNLSYSLDLAVL